MGLVLFLIALPFIYVLMKVTEKDEVVPSYLGFPEVTPYYELNQPEGHCTMVRDLIPNYTKDPFKALGQKSSNQHNLHKTLLELHANYLKDTTPLVNYKKSVLAASYAYENNAAMTQVYVGRIFDEYNVNITTICDKQQTVVAEWNITKLKLEDLAKEELAADILLKVEHFHNYESKERGHLEAEDPTPGEKFGSDILGFFPPDEEWDILETDIEEAWLQEEVSGSFDTGSMGYYPRVDDDNFDMTLSFVVEDVFRLPADIYDYRLTLVSQVIYEGVHNFVYRAKIEGIDFLLILKRKVGYTNNIGKDSVEGFRVYGPLPIGTPETLAVPLRVALMTNPQFNYV